MKFHKYPSLENHYNQKYINKVRLEVAKNPPDYWVVTEKLHGANFSIYLPMDKSEPVKLGKRSGFIGKNGEGFFNLDKTIGPTIIERATKLRYELVEVAPEGVEGYILYGELLGGKYEGVDNGQAKAIQKEVQYGPNHYIYIFDIAEVVNGELRFLTPSAKLAYNSVERAFYNYLNIDNTLCKLDSFTYYQSLDEALEVSENFITEIPSIHDLPSLEDNYAEGIVIKPVPDIYLYGKERVVIKKKAAKFLEKREASHKTSTPLPEEVLSLVQKSMEYINTNRLIAVCSKEGIDADNIDPKQLGTVIGLFSKDVVEDLQKEIDIPEEHVKLVRKAITAESAKFVKQKVFGYE